MRRSALVILTLLVVAALACRLAPPATPVPATTPTPPGATGLPAATPAAELIPTGAARAVSWPAAVPFASYTPPALRVKLNAPAYTPDLEALANPEKLAQFGLSEAQQAALAQNGFVVVPQGVAQIAELYQRADASETPAFVTTDALLHAFHVLYDMALRDVELHALLPDLHVLTAALAQASADQTAATDGLLRDAAGRNQVFFGVAAALLDPAYELPPAAAGLVRDELTLIESADGIYISPLLGVQEDYSQYRPRGHYTRGDELGRYFRAMMWLGRVGLRVQTPRDPLQARQELRQALLMLSALRETRVGDRSALAVWERIYAPTVFFVEAADDLTVLDLSAAAEAVYGSQAPAPAELADETKLSDLQATLLACPAPRILGAPLTDVELAEQNGPPRQIRFMGQRFVPDSAVFQQLVYSSVGLYQGDPDRAPFTLVQSDVGPIRGLPRGLDVAAAFSSARALEILSVDGDAAYDGYAAQLAALQAELAALPADQWHATLYWSWLDALQPLLEPAGPGAPAFMQSAAWTDKSLQTWLGSWTELRHDTILYAKQSYTAAATGMIPESRPVLGYVEPQPAVYARLVALTRQFHEGLAARDLLGDELRGKLIALEDLLGTLQTVAEKELSGYAVSEVEYQVIRGIGDRLATLTTFSAEFAGELTNEADDRMALAADVHTDPNSGQVLQEAIGDAFPIYVIVPVEGQQVLALGGVFSYYEFKQPLAQRLTDEAWQALAVRPDRPEWTAGFIIP